MTKALYREFVLSNPTEAKACVGFMKEFAGPAAERGQPLRVILTAEGRRRTKEQNAYYWAHVLVTIAETVWVDGKQYGTDVWHEMLAETYCPRIEVTLPNGTLFTRRKSTSEMTVKEFSEYVQKVEVHAASQLGVEFF